MSSRAIDLIASALAAPHTHTVVTSYADGSTKRHSTRNIEAAQNYATGERHKLGRDLIDRATMRTVRVVSVEVVAL